jgi:hypothetical protein
VGAITGSIVSINSELEMWNVMVIGGDGIPSAILAGHEPPSHEDYLPPQLLVSVCSSF